MPGEGLGGTHLGGSAFGPALGLQAPVTKRERSPSPSDCMSPDTINPPLSPADSSEYGSAPAATRRRCALRHLVHLNLALTDPLSLLFQHSQWHPRGETSTPGRGLSQTRS